MILADPTPKRNKNLTLSADAYFRPATTLTPRPTLPETAMLAAALGLALMTPAPSDAPAPMIGHMVYFTLKDRTPEAREAFAKSTAGILGGIPNMTFFAVGTLPPEAYEPAANDRDYDVALQVVFADKAAHTAYLTHPKHDEFVKVHKGHWSKVRVFDSVIVKK